MTAPAEEFDDDLLTLTPERIVYTLTEAALKLGGPDGVHRSTLGRLYHQGEIGGYTIGKRIYITQADLDDFIARGRAASPAAKKAAPEPAHIHVMRRSG